MAKTLMEELEEQINALNIKYKNKKVWLQTVNFLDLKAPSTYSQDVDIALVYTGGSANVQDTFQTPSHFQTPIFELFCRTAPTMNANENEAILNSIIKQVLNISTQTILDIYQIGTVNNYGEDEKKRNINSYTIAVSTVDYFDRF